MARSAKIVAGTGGKNSGASVQIPEVRNSTHCLGTSTGSSLHSNFNSLNMLSRGPSRWKRFLQASGVAFNILLLARSAS